MSGVPSGIRENSIARYARSLSNDWAGSRRSGSRTLRSRLQLRFDPALSVRPYPAAHNRRDCMLEDQLFLRVVLQQDRVLVEGAYFARKFHAAHQIDRDWALVFTDRVEKCVLDILCRLGFHGADLLWWLVAV